MDLKLLRNSLFPGGKQAISGAFQREFAVKNEWITPDIRVPARPSP
jgi:hypothetical protein